MSNTFDKTSVLDSFIEEVNSYLPTIDKNLQSLAQAPGDMDALEETYRCTHTIGGSASMMDFPGLSHVAHGMEDILGDVMEGLAVLDRPTQDLLQRSLGRLRRLAQGIHEGIDEDAVIAEDDADYMQYRMSIEGGERAQAPLSGELNGAGEVPAPAMPTAAGSPTPSIDEILESFRTPAAANGDIEWPEEQIRTPTGELQEQAQPAVPAETEVPTTPGALEMLAAGLSLPEQPQPEPEAAAPDEGSEREATSPYPVVQPGKNGLPQQYRAGEFVQSQTALPVAFDEVQAETHSLTARAASLKEILNQLRATMTVVEAQRAEFKGFLDGSKDALDRMEDWAGRAMGLNLRNSPEQVRRYLPLSVMWVANTKLKKVLDLLNQVTGNVEMTDEQIHALLRDLSVSITACGQAFADAQIAQPRTTSAQQAGWSPWEMQVARDEDMLRERVTFERRGDPAALRVELENQVREELRREYESRPLPLATRAELERQIREEVRQELEAQRQLQQQVIGAGTAESIMEMEGRLRGEIEIQVRQEFLAQIEATGGDLADVLSPPTPPSTLVPPSQTSNFLDQVRSATGLAPRETPVQEPPPLVASVPPPAPPEAKIISAAPPADAAARQAGAPAAYQGDFGEEASEIFHMEAEEHLQTISMYVAALEQDPNNRELIQGIRRATHTLKGAAGMMGFRAIADISHISEDLLDSIMEGTSTITPAVLSLILDTTEVLDALITGRAADPVGEAAKVEAMRIRYAEILGTQQQVQPSTGHEIDIEELAEEDAENLLAGAPGGSVFVGTNAQPGVRGDLSVRVRLQKLDELVNLFGELLVNRSILEERIERLMRLVMDTGVSSNRLRDVGQKLESRFEAATLPSGRTVQVLPGMGQPHKPPPTNGSKGRDEPSHLAEFDELELDRYTEFHQLSRGLSEGISDMTTLSTEMEAVIRDCESVFSRENRLSTTFQDRLMKARLVPLSMMTPRLYRAAQAVALKQGKEFTFLLEGEETEVDRAVYEEISAPLLHLMRNAITHAIQTPEARRQEGKPPSGQIKLSAGYEGNQVYITIRDDGAGIDPEVVRRTAIARGLIRPDQILSDEDVINLIFRPGFSTARSLSEESGRGVGLDVVHDSVSRLRGTLVVESMPGQGTAFTMKFPTSLAIQSAMMVLAGDQQFAIPTVVVGAIGRLDGYKRTTIGGRPAVTVQNEHYPLQMLADLLSLPSSAVDEKSQVLLVNTGTQRVALVVDEIRGKMDIVMKSLGPHLKSVHGIAGGTVMGNGRVVLVLEMNELLAGQADLLRGLTSGSTATRQREEPAQAVRVAARSVVASPTMQSASAGPSQTTAPAQHGKYVLVVDDSPSVRRVVSNMLKQYGWEVEMSRDGVEAVETITRETPAAVLLDIEMPRMDGYELIATLRAQEQYRTLPLIVLTSRAASKHQQRAMQLGASGYVVKPYQDEELNNLLNSLVYGAAAR